MHELKVLCVEDEPLYVEPIVIQLHLLQELLNVFILLTIELCGLTLVLLYSVVEQ